MDDKLNSVSMVMARTDERFREWAVLSVEKNRFGRDGVELEFRKGFDQGRFEATGHTVNEQLVDERVFTD